MTGQVGAELKWGLMGPAAATDCIDCPFVALICNSPLCSVLACTPLFVVKLDFAHGAALVSSCTLPPPTPLRMLRRSKVCADCPTLTSAYSRRRVQAGYDSMGTGHMHCPPQPRPAQRS